MTIVSAFFERYPGYRKLLNVFYNSARKKMPDSEIHILKFNAPTDKYKKDKLHNHHWDTYYAFMTKISHAIEINDNVLMSDTDIFFANTINDVWEKNFDIAITVRENKHKYNTGICFVKPTPEAKAFLKLWKKLTKEVADRFNIAEFMKWWGIDQTSLHYALQKNTTAKIIELPCKTWNAEQTYWRSVNADTKVIHIKSGLRSLFFKEIKLIPKHEYLRPILERIEKYEGTGEHIKFYKSTEVGISW